MKTKTITAAMVNEIVMSIPSNGRFFKVVTKEGVSKAVRATKDLVSLDFEVSKIIFGRMEFNVV